MGSPGNLQQQEIFIKDFKGGRKCTKWGAENAPLKLNNRKAGVRILIEKAQEKRKYRNTNLRIGKKRDKNYENTNTDK